MRLLLTNDDGIDAPGLQALYSAAIRLGDPVVVAPAEPLSGCSHRVTTGEPIRVSRRKPDHHAVEGTPAHCVRVALDPIAPAAAWALSGINAGGNLGADVWHSGTVAAVREAVLHGWPGIAFSYFRRKGMHYNWDDAARCVTRIVRDLMARP